MQDVTVIMPARNAAKTIEKAIQSVLAEPEVLEVIVINDGSVDETPQILAEIGKHEPRLVILEADGIGVTKAINRGIEVSRGVYFARCDADDTWKNARLSWQRPFLEENPDYVAISGGFSTVSDTGRHIADLAADGEAFEQTEALLKGTMTTHLCAMLIRMDAIKTLGGVREWFVNSQDLDLQSRIAGVGRVWHVPKPVLNYKLHDASITHSIGATRRKFFDSSAVLFAQQRLETGMDDLMRGNPPDLTDDIATSQDLHTAAEHIANHLTGAGWRRFGAGKYASGLGLLLRALWQQPTSRQRWRNVLVMMVKTVLPR